MGWLCGLSVIPYAKRSLVRFPGRAHTWAASQVPSQGAYKRQLINVCLSLSVALPFPLSTDKLMKCFLKAHHGQAEFIWTLRPGLTTTRLEASCTLSREAQ